MIAPDAAPIFDAIQKVTNHPEPYTDRLGADDVNNKDMAYRVVADHIRTLCFAIADGSRPGNEGREYVLRRVLRRGVRYGREVLGGPEGFFSALADTVVDTMGDAYPELVKNRARIVETLREEEASFSRTLIKGIDRFKKAAQASKASRSIAGQDAFVLWDTFGFPLDLTQLMAEEAGLQVDVDGFNKAMEDAKELSRAGAKKNAANGIKFEAEATAWLAKNGIAYTDDAAKYGRGDLPTKVVAILSKKGFVQSTAEALAESDDGPVGIVLEKTSFYAESGGQVADIGSLISASATDAGTAAFRVDDVIVAAGYVLHIGTPLGNGVAVGEEIVASVDYARRDLIMPNHTFTHILNFALRQVCGDHIDQKGSIVLPERLRFDFTNNGPVDVNKLVAVEAICKDFVSFPREVFAQEVALSQAKEIHGLRAVFGEVYPDPVRVVSVGKAVDALLADPKAADNINYPVEFCGGTHLGNTETAGAFALLTEEGIAKGIRRIVAVTGDEARRAIATADELGGRIAAASAKPASEVAAEVSELKVTLEQAAIPAGRKAELREEVAKLVKAVADEQKKIAAANKAKAIEVALAAAETASSSGAAYAIIRVPDIGTDTKALQEAWGAVQKKHPALSVMFFAEGGGKGLVYACVPTEVSKSFSAGEWAKGALDVLGGKGGGRPTMAQGMGPNVEAMDDAVKIAEDMAKLKLGSS